MLSACKAITKLQTHVCATPLRRLLQGGGREAGMLSAEKTLGGLGGRRTQAILRSESRRLYSSRDLTVQLKTQV